MKQYTPMIQQYLRIKAEYEDAFLFFRLGDFYELFFDDAIKAAKELEITLTSRDGGGGERIPMCGVPYHSAQGYIETLIEKGYKVAICEQMEDPKKAKGMVRREVVQLITPGTLMEGKPLADKENNFIASITDFSDGTFGLCLIDLSTGESRITLIHDGWEDCLNEISTARAKEVVVSSDFSDDYIKDLKERDVVTISYEDGTDVNESFKTIVKDLQQEKLLVTAARLLQYLYRTQMRSLDHIRPMTIYQIHEYMKIDYFSKRNLELTESIRSKSKRGSLLWLLDETMTAMGGRLLKQWLDRPLLAKEEISRRLHFVEVFKDAFLERQELREKLKLVYDIERLAGKVAFGNVNARELVSLKQTLQQIPDIKAILASISDKAVQELARQIDPCVEVKDLIERSIQDNPPVTITEGDIIRDGYHEKLDEYRFISRNGKSWIAELEKKERELTGIKSLKVGYNKVFGYYIEVTKPNLHLLPEGRYERKQTLTNAERFITPELKEKEQMILEAEAKIQDLEYELFLQIRDEVKRYIPRLQKLAKDISELDVLQSFATVSEKYRYVKPEFSDDGTLRIKDGRHPVVEKVMPVQAYVPNDCYMDRDRQILLITGPNMSGKSTYMRQVALIAIMAQIGCFVPASEAILPIFDQIYTRIGASDDLVSGQSTFMVEMLEAKNAIVGATENSLILFDEIGRGTSTYDGMALAQAIIEYIHDKIGAKTMFSTHYHELTDLENDLPRLKNIHVSAVEKDGNVVFLHKIKDGPTDQSYGIHVARLAELPDEVIERAREILELVENENNLQQPNNLVKPVVEEPVQLSFFADPETEGTDSLTTKERRVLQQLESLNLLEMTPLEAMNTLFSLQKKLRE
ncbi:MAG: DNA mismatch repair protein MutS [Caldibacillus sp.]